jgi:hypothetical protein
MADDAPPTNGQPADPPKLTREQAVEVVASWLTLFIDPDQVTELRALGVVSRSYRKPHTESGFFDGQHLREMAAAAMRFSGQAKGVYFVMNPIKPDLLARCANRTDVAESGMLTTDGDILRRKWLLVDADPVRDPHISATDAEKAMAHGTILKVRDYLCGEGWPSPILGDSGNGYHLLYRIDLPAEDGGVVSRILNALAERLNTDAVKIDRTVFNPARIVKLPGTLARKGDNVPDRPHRRAKLLEVPTA